MAYRLVARLIEAVPPGSFVVISHPPSDMQRLAPGLAQALAKLSQAMVQRVTPRSREQVTRFFDGVDLIEPGVVTYPAVAPGQRRGGGGTSRHVGRCRQEAVRHRHAQPGKDSL